MHSTVQTGLFTQNIFSFDYNYHHPSTNPHTNPYNHNPPIPHGYHHHHHQQQPKTSTHTLDANDAQNKEHLHSHSQTNEHNYHQLNQQKKCELCSSFDRFKYNFIYFWQCSKPCGILALIFGICSVISSIGCFIVVHATTYCDTHATCSVPIVKLCAISLLVVGIVILFVGIVIIVYTKRDNDANVIVTCSKHLKDFDVDCSEHLHTSHGNNHAQHAHAQQQKLLSSASQSQLQVQNDVVLTTTNESPRNSFLLKNNHSLHSSRHSLNKAVE